MSTLKTNERELTSKISEWMNEIIKRNNYPFTSVSNETGIKVGGNKTNKARKWHMIKLKKLS